MAESPLRFSWSTLLKVRIGGQSMRHVSLNLALTFVLAGIVGACKPVDPEARAANREHLIAEYGHDPAALEQEFGHQAEAACSVRVDDYLKTVVQYDFAWDEAARGLLGTKFDRIITESPGHGMLALKTTRVKFSNIYGAFQRVDVYCLYNATADKVVKFSLYNPLLDSLDRLEADKPTPAGDIIHYTPRDLLPSENAPAEAEGVIHYIPHGPLPAHGDLPEQPNSEDAALPSETGEIEEAPVMQRRPDAEESEAPKVDWGRPTI